MQQQNLQELEQKALSFPEQALVYKVADQATLNKANDFLLAIKMMQKEINETFDPVIKKAHDAHKEAVAQKKKHEAPLKEAEGIVKGAIGSYLAEQRRLQEAAEAEARRLAKEAEQKRIDEENKQRAEAQEAIDEGDFDKARDILAKEIPPPEMPPVLASPPKPALEGVSVRTIWKFRIIDENAIPREYLKIDETSIGVVVRTMKDRTRIPGIEVYSEDSLAARVGIQETRV